MSIQFPASPSTGDTYLDPTSGTTWEWDGDKWVRAFAVVGVANTTLISQGNTTAKVVDTGSDGSFQVLTEGTERLRITSTGNVGIGTDIPAEELHINGATPSIRLSDTAGSDLITRITNSQGDLYLDADFGGTTGDIIFRTNGERARIDSSGRLGIGTVSPGLPLDIVSDASSETVRYRGSSVGTATLRFTSNDAATIYAYIQSRSTFFDVGTSTSIPLLFSTDDTERARIDSSGRLLVGTTTGRTASSRNASFQLEGTSASTGSATFIRNGGSPYFGLYRTGSASIGSVTAVPADAGLAEIDFGGTDGTNVATGAYILGVNDSGSAWTTSSHPTRLSFWTTPSGSTTPVERLKIDKVGDVIVETGNLVVSTTNQGLYIGGGTGTRRFSDTSTGSGSTPMYIGNAQIQVTSDVHLKKNIEDTTLDALDAISRLKVKDFVWNDPSDTSYNNRNARGKWTGLIAQELVEVLPFVVNAPRKEEDGSIDYESDVRWTLDQSQLCPVLIKALQEALTKIETLEQRLTDAGL